MKNAKKLMLLLLSLVLLVGAFAVAAFAEDAADAATVVYPDGTVETYAVGETIVPKAFTDGFYEGKGNTLWQDDADAGWTFTVAGEAAALSDLKITQDMVGKTISASGVKQVYSVIDIHLPEGDYYEYITGSSYKIKVDGEEVEKKNAIYVLSGTSGTATHMVLENGVEVEKTVEYSTTKRVAGDYKLYFYDAASFVKFFSTSCSIELGGVVVDNKDLRTLKDTKITATLYADQTIGNTFYWGNGHDRATNKNMSNSIAQGEGGNAQVYFDLNGHTVVNNATGTMTLTEMTLVMYSSKPGAHFFKEASPTAFYVSDGCSFYVGNISTDNSTYSNNLSVHAKALFHTMYGGGAYITGGHYYQTAGATTPFFDFARRVNAIQNASFYVQNGNAVLDDNPKDSGAFASGTNAITNCNFYSFGSSPLTNLTQGATPAFSGCSFYNLTGVDGSETVAPKTVTFADGTTMQYFAETLEEAKAFVESLSQVKSPAPYGKWIDGEYMLSLNPIAEVTYDASFNATVAITDTAFAKVYYTTEEKQVSGITTMVYHTTDDFASYFTSANVGDQGDGAHTGALSYSAMCAKGAMTQIAITIYENVKCDWFTFTFLNNYTIKTLLDLNGYTLDLGNTSNQMNGMELWIYSSRPGAHFYSSANVAFTVNDVFTLNLGAADANGTYARNINFHCKNLLGNTYGSGAYIYGGNYYQLPGSSATGFVSIARRVKAINNANFFVLPGYSVFYDGAYTADFSSASTGSSTITGCSFYALGENVSLMNSVAGATPKFASCSFYGVSAENVGTKGSVDVTAATNTFDSALPTMRTLTWADGTTEKFFATSLEEAKAYVESLPKIKESAPYAVTKDGVLYMALTPTLSVEYDDNFNATVVGNDGPLTLVYYTVEETLTGKINYVTEPNIGAYLAWATHGGANVTLYQDMSLGNVTVLSERVPVDSTTKSQAENAVYKLDLNGHKLTFTGSGLALDVKVANLYIYSSVAGGTIDAKGHTLFRSNNDDYKWINGSAHVNGYDGSLYGAEGYTSLPYIKPINYTVLGEAAKTGDKVYADNLTVYCEKINQDMYGNGAYINGGTFIQDEGVNPGYFLMMGRSGGNASHVQVVKNATFVLNSTCTAVFNLGCNADRTFTNVTFISNNKSGAALTSFTALTHVSTFVDCNFVNVDLFANAKVVYDGGNINMSGIFTSEDLNAGEGEAYLVHAAEPKTVTANGETYVLNGTIVSDLSKVLKLTRENAGLEYWEIGAVVPTEAADVTKVVGNTIYMDAYYDYSGVAEIDADGKVINAGEASVAVAFNTELDVAFTYQVAGGEVQYVETLGDPEKDGANFVAILNNLFNVKIVMYSDIVLHSGVQFATLKDHTSGKKILDQTGYVDWDLNGCNVTVAANATPIAMVAEREGQGAQTNNVLHYTNASFKLYSSVPGGQYINLSSYPIFGLNKYVAASAGPCMIGSYLLGTNDPAVNGGDNLTIISKVSIIQAYETQGNGPEGYTLYVNGGTYVTQGVGPVFNVAATAKIYNAKLLTKGAAVAMITNHFWAPTDLTVENTEMIASGATTQMIQSGTISGINSNGKKHTVSISNVSFAGGTLNTGYGSVVFAISGDIKAPNAEGLNAAYPTAPDGKIPAYSSITVYGQTAKVLGYCDASAVVTVKNATTGLTEDWFAGATYYAGDASLMYKIDGVWYYYTVPVWEGSVDGEAVEDILAAENAGKTVVVNIGGEKELLYFTVEKASETVYYYGDAAAAKTSLEAILKGVGSQGFTLKLYADMTSSNYMYFALNSGSSANIFYFDLNGYAWTFDVPAGQSQALLLQHGKYYFYSSVPGARLIATVPQSIMRSDSGSYTYFGETDTSGTSYGKNITFEGKRVNYETMYGNSLYVYGGTYILSSADPINYIFNTGYAAIQSIKNATFVLENVSNIFKGTNIGGTIENCTFVSAGSTTLYSVLDGKMSAKAFSNCYFYNVDMDIEGGVTNTFENCYFDSSAEGALGAGFVAKTDKPVDKTVEGVQYIFDAVYTTSATLVDWGFGLDAEYWVIGAVAERDAAVVDGMFVYAFMPVEVGADPVTAEAFLVQTVGEKFLLELEITNQIIFRLYVAADCGLKTIEIDGATINLADVAVNDEGYYVLEKAYAPNHAADDIGIVVTGAYKHEFIINLEMYAASIMEHEEFAYYKNLTYALIEYVELMSGKDIAIDAPEGYEAYVASPEKAENAEGVLSLFSICHDDVITFAVMGKAGTNVVLTFNESDTIFEGVIDESGAVTFEFDDVKLLSETFTFEAGEEIYTYSLENYIYALENADAVDADVIEKLYALYNYAEHAVTYMAE